MTVEDVVDGRFGDAYLLGVHFDREVEGLVDALVTDEVECLLMAAEGDIGFASAPRSCSLRCMGAHGAVSYH